MANIRYQITDNSNALLEIYDVSGTLVRSFDLESSIMDHESVISWSGEDNTGRKLPGGVYFVKFRAGDYQVTDKLLLIR
jgi:flagellar hook assembly protein FlgD